MSAEVAGGGEESHLFARHLAAVLLFLFCGTAGAQLSPEVSRGVGWLAAQVQSSGALAGESGSVATPLQNRSEAAQTLKLLAAMPAALVDAVGAESDANTEYLSRKALVFALAGRDAATAAGLLLLRQNDDGGFGGQTGYESNALDTAFALIAFKSATQNGPVARALAYLQQVQAADGSYSAPGRPDVEASAYAAIALRLFAGQFAVAGAAQRAVSYLQSQQSAQLWGDSVFLSALAYEAIHDFIALEPTATAVRTFLTARQAGDGSWDAGDPFSTALALRALALTATAPADPTLAVVKAKVVDAQSGLALAGVNVALAGPSSFTRATGADGAFEFRNVAPGSYVLQLTLANYSSLSVTTSAQPGQVQDLGVLSLAKGATATTGTVRGIVKEASTDQPLAAATVTVAGGASALTDATGAYQIANVAPGNLVVQAAKAGYASVSGSGLLAAGGLLVFSPALSQGANQATATLVGRATQASNGAPLEGVSIAVSGANNAVAATNAAGDYALGNLSPGLIQIQASKAGYDPVNGSITIVGNSTLTFSPRMYPSGSTPPDANASRVSGVVVDSGTRQPIAGAQVSSSNGPAVVTGADGRFTFQGSGTTQQLTFAAAGYQGGSLLLNWGLAGLSEIGEVGLLRADAAPLLPDLSVTQVLRQGLLSDPQTLAASGTVSVRVANIGNALTQQPATLLVFEDRNRDGRFDPAVDLALGSTTLAAGFAIGEQTVPVALAGTLLFRDNALQAVIDRENQVPESNEGNNTRISSCSPSALPFFDDFNDGNADGWVQLEGRGHAPLSVVNGELVRGAMGANATGSFGWTDYSAEIKLRFPNGINNDAGLVFRALNAFDFHSIRFQSGLARIMRFAGGSFTALSSAGINILNNPAEFHTLKVDVAGTWARGYVNGQKLFELENIGWERGAVGTEQDGVLVHYEDLRVTPLTVVEDFNDGNADGWRPMSYGSSVATVVNGEYVRPGLGSSMFGSTSWKNYTAEVKLRFPNGMSNDGGLAILVRDPGSFAHVSINGGLVRFAVPGFGVVRSANVAVNTDPNFWHTLKAEVRGRTVKWYLNGQFLFDFDNLPWDNGAVGTIQDGVLVHYDDLRVTFGESSAGDPDLSASLLRLTQQVNFHTLTVRVGNGGGGVAPAGVRVAFYNGAPGAGGVLLGTAPTSRALVPGDFEDVSIPYPGALTALTEVVAVVDENGVLAECDETNNRIGLPIAAVPGVFNIRVETDQPSYGAHADVRATAVVGNFFGLPRPAQVRFRIESGDGAALVTQLPLPAPVTVGAGGIASVPVIWNTGTTLTGSYRVRAELLDAGGAPSVAALAPFLIFSGVTQTVTSAAITDKPSYAPSDTVNLTARITNTTANTPLDDLRVATTVLNPDGSVRFTQTEILPQLPQGTLRDYFYNVALAFAPAGTYSAVVSVRNAAGETLVSSSASFAVLSSSTTGSGLAGTLAATPKPVPFGDAVTLSASVSNRGNSAQNNLPVVLRVVDPATQAVLAEFQRTMSIAQGATQLFSEIWPSGGNVGATVVAVLSATVGGTALTLAQDTVTIVRLSGNLSVVPKSVPQGDAVLITQTVQNTGLGTVSGVPITLSIVNAATGEAAAQWSETPTLAPGAVFQAARSFTANAPVGTLFNVSLTATIGGAAKPLARDSFTVIAPPVRLDASLDQLREGRVLALVSCKSGDDAPDDAACRAARAAFLDAYLTGLGITHLVTTDGESFERALRGGQYNIYWVSGGAEKLHGTLAEEVREALFRGDALLLDGVHDARNGTLDPAAGVIYRGKLAPVDQAVSVAGSLFVPNTLGSTGRALNLELAGGEAQAQFTLTPAPAIVSHAYGRGRGLLFAYDLVGALIAQPSPAQDALIGTALGWLAPNVPATASGLEYAVLRARIGNLGQAVELRVTLTPPEGSTVLSTAPGAAADASGRPVWSFSLAVDETKDLLAGVRLPAGSGSYAASIAVESVRNGIAHPYGTFGTAITVEDFTTVAERTISALMAVPVGSADKADRNHAVSSIQSAQSRLGAGHYEQAIADLVGAAERLLKIKSVDVTPYRVDVGRLLKEAEARWAAAQP